MDPNKTGEYIATCRRRLGWSQQQLADVLDVSNKTVSKWETGGGLPDIGSLPALAEALNTTVDNILAGEEKAPPLGAGAPGEGRLPHTGKVVRSTVFRVAASIALAVGIMACLLLLMPGRGGGSALPAALGCSIFSAIGFIGFLAVYKIAQPTFASKEEFRAVWRPYAIAGAWIWSAPPILALVNVPFLLAVRPYHSALPWILALLVWLAFSIVMTVVLRRKKIRKTA